MTKPDLALARINGLAYAFANIDSFEAGRAAANLANNCPAFWHTGTATGAVGGLMVHLNEAQDVIRAIEALALFARKRVYDLPVMAMLDGLLPLNRAAADKLAEAYEEFSTFRTAGELLRRTEKAGDFANRELAKLTAGATTKPIAPLDARSISIAREATITAPVAMSAKQLRPANINTTMESAS